MDELVDNMHPLLQRLALLSRAEVQRRRGRVLGRRETGRPAGATLSQFVCHRIGYDADDKGGEDRSLLAMSKHLNLAFGDGGNRMLLDRFRVVLGSQLACSPREPKFSQFHCAR